MSETKLKRQIIFVSGAYRSKYGIIGRAVNIWKAYQVGRRLVRQGYSCYIPHMNTALMDGLQSEDWFLEATLKMLKHCQILFLMRGWQQSMGARAEWREANERGLTIIFEDGSESVDKYGMPDWDAIEPCTEPVTVPYKLEPEVKV